jgi:hypothetical protein
MCVAWRLKCGDGNGEGTLWRALAKVGVAAFTRAAIAAAVAAAPEAEGGIAPVLCK